MPVKIKRSHVIAAAIILVIGIAWVKGFWFTEVFRTHKSNEPHRTALFEMQFLSALHTPTFSQRIGSPAQTSCASTLRVRLVGTFGCPWSLARATGGFSSSFRTVESLRFKSAHRMDLHPKMDRTTNRKTQANIKGRIAYVVARLTCENSPLYFAPTVMSFPRVRK